MTCLTVLYTASSLNNFFSQTMLKRLVRSPSPCFWASDAAFSSTCTVAMIVSITSLSVEVGFPSLSSFS